MPRKRTQAPATEPTSVGEILEQTPIATILADNEADPSHAEQPGPPNREPATTPLAEVIEKAGLVTADQIAQPEAEAPQRTHT